MEDKDYIKDLFSQKLGNYEADVNPQLWDKIASQVTVGASAAATGTGLSLFAKWMIGLGVSAVVGTTAVIITTQSSEEPIMKTDSELIVDTQEKNADEASISEKNSITQEETSERVSNSTAVPSNELPSQGSELTRTPNAPLLNLPTAPLDDQNALVDHQQIHHPIVAGGGEMAEEESAYVADPEAPEDISPETKEPEAIVDNDYWIEKLPNVFTPNNDGANDVFMINSKGLLDFNIVVLDRTSQVVFTSNDPNFRWSGMNNIGEPVAEGNYVYFITAKDSKGNSIKEYSTISITR